MFTGKRFKLFLLPLVLLLFLNISSGKYMLNFGECHFFRDNSTNESIEVCAEKIDYICALNVTCPEINIPECPSCSCNYNLTCASSNITIEYRSLIPSLNWDFFKGYETSIVIIFIVGIILILVFRKRIKNYFKRKLQEKKNQKRLISD